MNNLPHGERRRARLDDQYEHERQRDLVKDTVKETLLSLGLEIDDPIKMQKDFQHLRDWREASESLKSHGLTTLVGILLAGLLGAIWMGIKNVLGYHN